MTYRLLSFGLCAGLLLIPGSQGYAAEPGAEVTAATKTPSSTENQNIEDQEVIVLMELLQKMELLKDLDLMAATEEKQ